MMVTLCGQMSHGVDDRYGEVPHDGCSATAQLAVPPLALAVTNCQAHPVINQGCSCLCKAAKPLTLNHTNPIGGYTIRGYTKP